MCEGELRLTRLDTPKRQQWAPALWMSDSFVSDSAPVRAIMGQVGPTAIPVKCGALPVRRAQLCFQKTYQPVCKKYLRRARSFWGKWSFVCLFLYLTRQESRNSTKYKKVPKSYGVRSERPLAQSSTCPSLHRGCPTQLFSKF